MRKLEPHNKVFGLGLSRTGTSSLTVALYRLGVHVKHYPTDPRTYEQLRNGDYHLDTLAWCQGLTDVPIPAYFAQFDQAWPGSKFILTLREKESWLRSVEQLWQRSMEWSNQNAQYTQIDEFFRACVYGSIQFTRERFSYVYDTHVRNVLHYFQDRPDDLLVLDICAGEGWEKLCPFLGIDVPDQPFPHSGANRSGRGSSEHAATDATTTAKG
jgi:hypothetical protein